jgi:hypothetical protein
MPDLQSMSPDAEHALADLDAAGTDHAYAHRCTDGQWYRLGHRCPTRQNLLHAETHVRALIGAVEKAAADPDALRTVAEGMTGLTMADLDGDSREGWQTTARLAVLTLAAWLSDPTAGKDRDDMSETEVQEPIEVGWYAYSGGAQTMVFHLRDTGQWSAHFDNGSSGDCAWGYVEQALDVWTLDRIPLPVPSPVLNPPETLTRLVEQWGSESIYDAFVTRWPQVAPAPAGDSGGERG